MPDIELPGIVVPVTLGALTVDNPPPADQNIDLPGIPVPVTPGALQVDNPTPQDITLPGIPVSVAPGALTVTGGDTGAAPQDITLPGIAVPVTLSALTVAGGDVSPGDPGPPPSNTELRVARPPLELAVEVTGPDGTQRWWSPASEASSIPQNITLRTKQSEGFADAGLTLARRIDRDYIDVHLLDSVVIAGVDGSVAYEGRVAALPRSMQQTHQLSVQLVGWMAHTRDRKMDSEIFVDRDLAAFGQPSRAWQASQLAANFTYTPGGFNTAPDSTNVQALQTRIGGTWISPYTPLVEALYDAGNGEQIAKVYYDFVAGGALNPADAGWSWGIIAGDTDAAFPTSSGSLRAASGAGYYSLANARRYAMLQQAYSTTPGGVEGADYLVSWRNLAVYGDHGLPLIGPDPKGVAASEVIQYLIAKYCPGLNTGGVAGTDYPIPHLTFKDRTDPYDALLEVNKYHLWQLAVYENRTLSFGPVNMSDYDWEVRLSDKGVTVDLQGDSTSALANGIVVQYQDVATGQQAVLTPADHSELRDPSDNNPATLHGLNVWTEINLSSPSTADAALQIGRAALAEFNQPKAPGTISVQGHIRDRAGHWQPVWKVRSSDRVIIADHPNDRARLIVETDYQHDSKTVSLSVDSTFKRLDAVLDRVTTALRAANLG